MSELSNFIRQRIAGAQNGSPHPDADTITAYVEQCLPAKERETVAGHFAVCEPCREILALSQPEIAEAATQTVLKPAPVSAWRRLFAPKFGVAALIASMAIIAALVLHLPHHADNQQNQQAQAGMNQIIPAETSQAAPTQPAETLAANKEVAESQSVAASAPNKSHQIHNRVTSAKVRLAAPPSPPRTPIITAGLLKKDYVNTDFFSNSGTDVVVEEQSSNIAPSAPQPQAAKAIRAFDTSSRNRIIFPELPASTESKSNTVMFTRSAPSERCKFCSKVAQVTVHTFRAHLANPLRSSTISSSTLGEPGMFSSTLQKSESIEVSSAPEKTSDGSSLSSTDAFSSGALGGSAPRMSKGAAVLWKVAGGKLIKSVTPSVWEDGYPAAGIQFSSVNARGNDIWAGGNDAALIHSHDGGLTWDIVKMGEDASGAIVGITVDSTNVQVNTSDKQVWSSTDGGKTWSQQE